MKKLEVTIHYADGTVLVVANPERDDEVGRKLTERLAMDLMADPAIAFVDVIRRDQVAGGQRGTYR